MEVINSCQPKQLQLEVVQSGVGNITESEVEIASSIGGKTIYCCILYIMVLLIRCHTSI